MDYKVPFCVTPSYKNTAVVIPHKWKLNLTLKPLLLLTQNFIQYPTKLCIAASILNCDHSIFGFFCLGVYVHTRSLIIKTCESQSQKLY